MPFATDEEIKIAHDILLKDKKPFDSNKVNIIKEDSSCYIQACPGSGKTTTLLAKLIIIANKMPLPKGKGICVLTHTNVAIDEIKAKLGTKADVLFRYPNFCDYIILHKNRKCNRKIAKLLPKSAKSSHGCYPEGGVPEIRFYGLHF